MKTRREWLNQDGMALLEVLFASIILGIAVIGVSLMLSRAQSSVVGQGDRYVALYLAQQKLESLTALALQNPPAGFDNVLPMGTSTETNLHGRADRSHTLHIGWYHLPKFHADDVYQLCERRRPDEPGGLRGLRGGRHLHQQDQTGHRDGDAGVPGGGSRDAGDGDHQAPRQQLMGNR